MPDSRQSAVASPYLTVALRHHIGALRMEVQFELTKAWTILFGASGSGKTTILRAIAGLIAPEFGRILAYKEGEATMLLDTASRVNVAPYRRGTPLAPQSPALFPHLTVEQNFRYGGGAEAGIAAIFEIEQLQSKFPAQLSGGEAQRVSLARAAMASRPRLLLLDEPFTGLDLPLRYGLISDLLQWQEESGVPILSVTHDVAEAFQLGAEVIQLQDGRVIAQGPVAEVLAGQRERLLNQLKGD